MCGLDVRGRGVALYLFCLGRCGTASSRACLPALACLLVVMRGSTVEAGWWKGGDGQVVRRDPLLAGRAPRFHVCWSVF